MIQRYDILPARFEELEGEYVLHADHADHVAALRAENEAITDINVAQFLELEHLRRVFRASETLIAEAEEYDFDDSLGQGAPQQYWDALTTEIDTMSDAQEEARKHVTTVAALWALAELGRWCLTESRDNDCGDVDGGSLQDKAIELGLLAYVTVAEPCGEACACMDYYAGDEWPHDCLRETERAALKGEP